MNTKLSREQRIRNVAAGQMVEELKGRHAYLHGVNYGREEYGVFWLRSTDTTWGHGWGRLIGYEEMFQAHCGQAADDMFGSGRFAKWWGGEQDGHDRRSTNWGSSHVLASPVIEVADDGLTARSWYLTPGTMMNRFGEDGQTRSGWWLWERYGSDFVYKDGKWWWAHEQVCPDIAGGLDEENWAQSMYQRCKSGAPLGPPRSAPDGEGAMEDHGPPRSDKEEKHKEWNMWQPVQHTVDPPVPYVHMDDENTYSPGYNKFDVILPQNRSYGGDLIDD